MRHLSAVEGGVAQAVLLQAFDPILEVLAEHHGRCFRDAYAVGLVDTAGAPGVHDMLDRFVRGRGAICQALREGASLVEELAGWGPAVAVSDTDTITCSGGAPTRLWPWTINDNDLIATEFGYTVRAASDSALVTGPSVGCDIDSIPCHGTRAIG